MHLLKSITTSIEKRDPIMYTTSIGIQLCILSIMSNTMVKI